MSKQLAVKVAGTDEIYDMEVEPGTTPHEILNAPDIGLGNDYDLSPGGGQEIFGQNQNIYPEVEDGQKLIATTNPSGGQKKPASPNFSATTGVNVKGKRTDNPRPGRSSSVSVHGKRRTQTSHVGPDKRDYWKEKNWEKKNRGIKHVYQGWYSPDNTAPSKGKIEKPRNGPPKVYIKNYPNSFENLPELHNGSCLTGKSNRWTRVHFKPTEKPETVDDAILYIENLLKRAKTGNPGKIEGGGLGAIPERLANILS